MNCRFCKLTDIDLIEGGVYKCSYCGYSFDVSRTAVLYDKMMKMPLSSWLLASILWFSAMLTGVLLGLGFTSSSLSTTILFLFIYGASAFLYGFSTSLDMMQTFWLFIKYRFRRKEKTLDDVKQEMQVLRKKKIVSEMATGQSLDEATGKFIDTDIRPGEKRIPAIAPAFLAGLYTIGLGIFFTIIFNIVFPPFN
ncbi:MAG: hypothetical protein H7644_05895 [Candidatus Heimdallarchaeota archaeon]|nr:hypothetical protein [Candidatus Heimdallarchaeota archaeon]MCK5143280.1 hypothetical protein [Candidatus Heimdallarchaeota archaeon]